MNDLMKGCVIGSVTFILLITVSLSGCIDDYEHPQSYLDGYNEGYENHNITVLNACIDYIDAAVKLSIKETNNAFLITTIYYPIELKESYGGTYHVMPYVPLFSREYKNMERLDDYTSDDNEHWMIGYIAGYDDWYNGDIKATELHLLESKKNEALDIINKSS